MSFDDETLARKRAAGDDVMFFDGREYSSLLKVARRRVFFTALSSGRPSDTSRVRVALSAAS